MTADIRLLFDFFSVRLPPSGSSDVKIVRLETRTDLTVFSWLGAINGRGGNRHPDKRS